MRRIKSAPANLSSMTNNKRTSISLLTKNNNVAIPLKNTFTPNYQLRDFKKFKELKNNISFNSNLANDILNDSNNFTIEESTLVFTLINFIANNILKREKFQEIYNYLIQAIVRYFIMLFIHTHILHEKINIPLIDYNYLDTISNSISNCISNIK